LVQPVKKPEPLMRAVVVESLGGPEVLNVREAPRPSPAAGQTLIEVHRAGVNYTDLGRREHGWRFPPQPLPVIPGWEIAGRRISDGVRVIGLLTTGIGGYAEYALVPDELTVPIPDGVEDAAALAVLVQGLTAWHALVSAARVQPGETVAVTAAAGGVGSLAIQIARLQGAARVIAVTSTEDKRLLTMELGADAAVDGTPDGFADRLQEANNGAAVDVVLESVGGPIVDAALTALAHGGRLVAYGQASGASNMVSLDDLMDHSIGVIGYWALPHMHDLGGTRRTIKHLLGHVASGRLRPVQGPSFPIGDAARAHTSVASRATVGKVTLIVDEAAWSAGED
jgi:NADPH2:quinone reductase